MQRLIKPQPEVLHYSVKAETLSIVEINVSITVISLPTLMPIVDWILDRSLDIGRWFRKEKDKVNGHMNNTSHGKKVIEGMLLKKSKPRRSLSASELEMGNLGPEHLEDESQIARREQRSFQGGEVPIRQNWGFQTTSSGSVREREERRQLVIANE